MHRTLPHQYRRFHAGPEMTDFEDAIAKQLDSLILNKAKRRVQIFCPLQMASTSKFSQ